MNNIFVYIENEGGKAAEVCLELMTKGRELATTLGVKLEAVVLGENLFTIPHDAIKDVPVLATYVGGECVYKK